MPLQTNQPFWRYAVFQFFAGFTVLFLILALLTSLLGWFPPSVAVHIALDLSSSTYETSQVFRGPGTIMEQELQAVKDYVARNSSLAQPNSLSVSGFAEKVVPITGKFSSNQQDIIQSIDRVVQPSLANEIGGNTDINLAVENSLSQLKSQVGKCKNILVITDGAFNLEQSQVNAAKSQAVKLSFLITGQSLNSNIVSWATQTGGVALSTNPVNISQMLTGQLFNQFNNNPLVPIFYGLAFISLMWMLLLPFDRLMQNFLKIRPDYSGKIALFNAIFWTVITPLLLLLMGINPLNRC